MNCSNLPEGIKQMTDRAPAVTDIVKKMSSEFKIQHLCGLAALAMLQTTVLVNRKTRATERLVDWSNQICENLYHWNSDYHQEAAHALTTVVRDLALFVYTSIGLENKELFLKEYDRASFHGLDHIITSRFQRMMAQRKSITNEAGVIGLNLLVSILDPDWKSTMFDITNDTPDETISWRMEQSRRILAFAGGDKADKGEMKALYDDILPAIIIARQAVGKQFIPPPDTDVPPETSSPH